MSISVNVTPGGGSGLSSGAKVSDSRSGTKSGPSYSWHLDMAVMMRSFIVRCW